MVTRTKKIFVGGLSAATTLEEVKAYFQRFGEVSSSDCFSSHHHSHDHDHHHDHVVTRGNHHPDSKEILHNNVLNHHHHHHGPHHSRQTPNIDLGDIALCFLHESELAIVIVRVRFPLIMIIIITIIFIIRR